MPSKSPRARDPGPPTMPLGASASRGFIPRATLHHPPRFRRFLGIEFLSHTSSARKKPSKNRFGIGRCSHGADGSHGDCKSTSRCFFCDAFSSSLFFWGTLAAPLAAQSRLAVWTAALLTPSPRVTKRHRSHRLSVAKVRPLFFLSWSSHAGWTVPRCYVVSP